MERKVSFISIGVLFLSIIVGFVIFLIFIGKIKLGNDNNIYTIYTTQDVTGLSTSTPIKYKGITVGGIHSINFNKNSYDSIAIKVSIKKDLLIPMDSKFELKTQGLAGLGYLALNIGKSSQYANEETHLSLESSLLNKLSSKAEGITEEVAKAIRNFNNLLNRTNVNEVSDILKSINHLSAHLDETQANINLFIKNTNILISTINSKINSGNYDFSKVLTPLILKLSRSINSMEAFFNRGNNLLDKFDRNPYETIFGAKK